jgi:hypothetical protein
LLATAMFGGAIDYGVVRVVHRKWWPFQSRDIVMAPDGNLWFHPEGALCHDDFSCERLNLQGLFIHEMTHVWQAQRGGRWFLPLARHPFRRYDYRLIEGRAFHHYGLEQQAEIVKHAFLLRAGVKLARPETLTDYEAILPFER